MKIKLKPSKHVSPSWLSFVVAGLYVTCVVLTISALISRDIRLFIPVPIILLGCFILSKCFAWYVSAEFREFGKMLVYTVEMPVGVLGRNTCKYEIKKIDSYKKKGKALRVYGTIIDHEPCQKPKEVKFVQIDDYTQDVVDMIEKFIGNTVKA